MKKLITIATLLVLVGCGGPRIQSGTQVVKEVITVKCKKEVKVEELTEYHFDKATKEMSLHDKYKLASAERKALRGENKKLRTALDKCTE